MKMPEEARERFDFLLTRPLQKTNTHKKQVSALRERLQSEGGSPEALAVVDTASALLSHVERKTSPLYVRLIHAAALYLIEDTSGDWPLIGQVMSAVAHSTKHFELE